jgi:hypothetical protein
MVEGSIAAIIKPSVEITAEASMSAELPFKSLKIEFKRSARIVYSLPKPAKQVNYYKNIFNIQLLVFIVPYSQGL